MQILIALTGAAIFAGLCGYVVGRAAQARSWSARKSQWWCLAAGVVCGPGAFAIVEAVSGRAMPGWLGGAGVAVMWDAWIVCARVAGFRFNQVADEEAQPIRLDLSQQAERR